MEVEKKKIKDLINEAKKQEKWWEYNKSLSVNSVDEDFQFIADYLDFAEKTKFISSYLHIQNSSHSRIRHIVNAFFLGVSLYNKSTFLHAAIDTELDKYRYALDPYHKEAPFAYVWFLICLFHDCGYDAERNSECNNRFKDFDSLVNQYGGALGKLDGVPNLYQDILNRYFQYRIDDNGCNVGKGVNDHGIVGGFRLYHDLCEIRAERRSCIERNSGNKDLWVKGLDDVYNLVAWVIACHNIFFANADDKCKICRYSAYHLYSLMKEEKDYKIHLMEHPLFFFLHLIDNIEMMKIKEFEEKYIDAISLCINDKEMFIEVQVELNDDKKRNNFANEYIRRLKDLDKWLTTTEISNNINNNSIKSVKIYFKPKN